MHDDLTTWVNYTPSASDVEQEAVHEIVGDSRTAERFLEFGLRPLSLLDFEPGRLGPGFARFEVTRSHLHESGLLVDISTGHRFRYDAASGDLIHDLDASNHVRDAHSLLERAHARKLFEFQTFPRPVDHAGVTFGEFPHVLPLEFQVSSKSELQDLLSELASVFCDTFRAKRLWLRGQRSEYNLLRDTELCTAMYGNPKEPSLLPSAGRFMISNPTGITPGSIFSGPGPAWKKPFLIWIMRENPSWFSRDPRAFEALTRALADSSDEDFVRILVDIQGGHGFGEEDAIVWPDEADDLRQWFFAFMKHDSFAVTLQQYGYITSLLDITDNLEVALYFAQAAMVDGRMRMEPPRKGRLIYVFAETNTGDLFRHGDELFWGDSDWKRAIPPRLKRQHAGFLMGSTCRTQNFYAQMIVARIFLEEPGITTDHCDADLFPSPKSDLLYSTLRESRPAVDGLY